MIKPWAGKKFCNEDISLIENYNLALNDKNNIYDIHHRLETDLNVSRQYLIDNNLYYDRPASELIFLTHSEHARLHNQFAKLTDEQKKKGYDKQKGRKFTEEHRLNLSKSHLGLPSNNKGNHLSEETKEKLSNYFKGKPNIKNKGSNNGMYGKPAVNRKSITQCDLNENIVKVYVSLKELFNELHISLKEVINCCKGKRDSYKNYIWKYT